jgi:hypothetical protein
MHGRKGVVKVVRMLGHSLTMVILFLIGLKNERFYVLFSLDADLK